MTDNIKIIFMYIFLIIGISVSSLLVIYAFVSICAWLGGSIRSIKWKYKYKHRFDKPPLAKCYCKDCEYYGGNNNRSHGCWKHSSWAIVDDWFCCDATPCKKDPEKEEAKEDGA